MPDEPKGAKLTALGREEMLEEHEDRLDALEQTRVPGLENRVTAIEGKEATRDKRWELVLRAVVTIGGGIIIAIVSALLAGGKVHP